MTARSNPADSRQMFMPTRWSLVAAARSGGAADAARSLAELCRDYWYPVYAYLRRSGHEPAAADALTRGFFAGLREQIRTLDPQLHGRFRTFLLERLHRHLADAEPRAVGPEVQAPQPLAAIERRLAADEAAHASPDAAFQRGFGLELMARALQRLRAEALQGGRVDMFERLEPYLTRDPAPGQYASIAEELRTPPLALPLAVRRLRQRFRELVDEELGHTVASADDLEAERDALLVVLAGGAP